MSTATTDVRNLSRPQRYEARKLRSQTSPESSLPRFHRCAKPVEQRALEATDAGVQEQGEGSRE